MKNRTLTWDAKRVYLDDQVIHDFSHYSVPEIRKSMIEEQVSILSEQGDGHGNPCHIPSGYIRGADRAD